MPEADLVDLRERLTRTRWPDPATVGGWTQGVPLDYARDLCEYWRTRYSWRRCEAELNALPQFRTSLDGGGDDAVDVHFLHVRSPPRRRAAAAADPRLARLDRGVPRRPRRADRSGRAPTRATPSTWSPVTPRLRVQRQADARRLGRGADRRGLGAAHGPARLRPLRRAGRRLGIDGHRGAGLGDPGAARRDPPDDAGGAASGPRRPAAEQVRAGGADGPQGVPEGRHGLRPRAGDPPADPRLRARRLPRRAVHVDRREVLGLERLRGHP